MRSPAPGSSTSERSSDSHAPAGRVVHSASPKPSSQSSSNSSTRCRAPGHRTGLIMQPSWTRSTSRSSVSSRIRSTTCGAVICSRRSSGGSRPNETAPEEAVGFADLSGFTKISQRMDVERLAELVDEFEEAAFDVVSAHGGRTVKLIGDEVIFVFSVRCPWPSTSHSTSPTGCTPIRSYRRSTAVSPTVRPHRSEATSSDPAANLAARLTNDQRVQEPSSFPAPQWISSRTETTSRSSASDGRSTSRASATHAHRRSQATNQPLNPVSSGASCRFPDVA